MNLEKKKMIVASLQEEFAKSKVVIVTDYKGLDVTTINLLRSKLTQAGIEYKVAKNSLLRRASEGNDVALIKDAFTGPNAVAYSYDDAVAPAKVLSEFAKEEEKLEIKIGVLDGKVLDLAGIKALSSLPSREVLIGKLLSTMNAVPSTLVRALGDVPARLVNVLSALRDQKEAV